MCCKASSVITIDNKKNRVWSRPSLRQMWILTCLSELKNRDLIYLLREQDRNCGLHLHSILLVSLTTQHDKFIQKLNYQRTYIALLLMTLNLLSRSHTTYFTFLTLVYDKLRISNVQINRIINCDNYIKTHTFPNDYTLARNNCLLVGRMLILVDFQCSYGNFDHNHHHTVNRRINGK